MPNNSVDTNGAFLSTNKMPPAPNEKELLRHKTQVNPRHNLE